MKTLFAAAAFLAVTVASCCKKADVPQPSGASTPQLQADPQPASHAKLGPAQPVERYPSRARSLPREHRPL